MRNTRPLPPQSLIRDLLDYDSLTGVFTWRRRVGELDKKGWNSKWAGKNAGVSFGRGDVTISIFGIKYLASRLAWVYIHGDVLGGGIEIDHRSVDPTDNSIGNLRIATRSQNQANMPPKDRDLPKGVSRKRGRFRARIKVDYKEIWLGTFDTPELARAAYEIAAATHFGEYARTA